MAHLDTIPQRGTRHLPPLDKGNYNKRLGMVAVIATFGGLLFGYDTGVLNGALSFISSYFNITPWEQGLVTFVLLIGAATGSFLGGRISDRYGRRAFIIALAVLFFIGTSGSVLSLRFDVLLVFRFVLGLAVGGASVTVPVYLAEVAPFEKRGSLVSRNELMIVTGQFLAFLINAIIGNTFASNPDVWRYMLSVAAVPAFVLFFGMLRMPESPRWLVSQGRNAEALAVLRTMRSPERAAAEMAEVHELAEEERLERLGSWKEVLTTPWTRRLLFIGFGIGIFQQLTGINSMMYYGTQVLEQAGFDRNAALSFNVLNGVASVLPMLVALYIINRVSRRSMMITGFIGTTTAHIGVGLVGILLPEDSLIRPWILLAFILMFIAMMQATIGPLAWLMISEIFPLRMRGLMIGASVLVLWLTNAVVALMFPALVAVMGFGTFLVFAVIGFVAIAFTVKFLPETRGRSLEEFEETFKSGALSSPK
ncbi:sugar porter family MFS transporter [Pseudarthrobacter enclensis]|uniref:Sugar porter (SP) family MFS transporter n=1 Tax=Pseudarthrobacter enclensis TaxID=993070 RepID=A0ABT9RWS5_9MICC|nr:sugar porter family MFS transporter [Pseudarthrobacter enclensis]MDP9889058.1 sugar porter (SP) family MFS transporter [Pseudarthrobacter enclensis]